MNAKAAEKATKPEDTAKPEEPPRFSRDYLPEPPYINYRKTTETQAVRIDGPFSVKTTEGEMTCEDGYLALDAGGNPYPISKEVFDQTYIEVSADNGSSREAMIADVREQTPAALARAHQWRIEHMRDQILSAILQNPNVTQYVQGSPLDDRNSNGYASIGAFLADRCQLLAEKYLAATDELDRAARTRIDFLEGTEDSARHAIQAAGNEDAGLTQ